MDYIIGTLQSHHWEHCKHTEYFLDQENCKEIGLENYECTFSAQVSIWWVLCPCPCSVFAVYQPGTLPLAPSVDNFVRENTRPTEEAVFRGQISPIGSWKEECAIRHVEPALAFQLELSRLSNYNLTPIFIQNKQLHIYHGIARENQLGNRFFIRALVRPGRVRDGISTAEYLISETDRLVTSILDSLEVASAKRRSADCNHIFINFVYNLPVTYSDVLEAISGFIERHGKRLSLGEKGGVLGWYTANTLQGHGQSNHYIPAWALGVHS